MYALTYDSNDAGYISDVPSVQAQSEDVSQELVESTRVLEKHFKDKYRMLRDAYETRIQSLTGVVEETCSKLFSDELLNELKKDKTSAGFIPAYISEIIANHLQSESEIYIHDLLQKASIAELKQAKSNDSISQLTRKVQVLESELIEAQQHKDTIPSLQMKLDSLSNQHHYHSQKYEQDMHSLQEEKKKLQQREQQLINKIEILSYELKDKNKKCDHLKHQLDAKSRDIADLEQSFEQNSREVSMIESMERQESALKREMKEQIRILSAERTALGEENQQLRVNMKHASEEMDRCMLIRDQCEASEAASKQKIAALMEQVEKMLVQEADESNAAISVVHDKMKTLRLRMSEELQHEKRLSSALQEEVDSMKVSKVEMESELQRLKDRESTLQEELVKDKQQCLAREAEVKAGQAKLNELNTKLAKAEAHAKQADEIMKEYKHLKHHAEEVIAQKAALDKEREKDADQRKLDQQAEALRIKYQNELTEIKAQLNNAYKFSKGDNSTVTAEMSYKKSIQGWAQEHAKLKQKHTQDIQSMETRLKSEYESVIKQLQGKLMQASNNIDRLKRMVTENKSVVNQQAIHIEHLQTEKELLSKLADSSKSNGDAVATIMQRFISMPSIRTAAANTSVDDDSADTSRSTTITAAAAAAVGGEGQQQRNRGTHNHSQQHLYDTSTRQRPNVTAAAKAHLRAISEKRSKVQHAQHPLGRHHYHHHNSARHPPPSPHRSHDSSTINKEAEDSSLVVERRKDDGLVDERGQEIEHVQIPHDSLQTHLAGDPSSESAAALRDETKMILDELKAEHARELKTQQSDIKLMKEQEENAQLQIRNLNEENLQLQRQITTMRDEVSILSTRLNASEAMAQSETITSGSTTNNASSLRPPPLEVAGDTTTKQDNSETLKVEDLQIVQTRNEALLRENDTLLSNATIMKAKLETTLEKLKTSEGLIDQLRTQESKSSADMSLLMAHQAKLEAQLAETQAENTRLVEEREALVVSMDKQGRDGQLDHSEQEEKEGSSLISSIISAGDKHALGGSNSSQLQQIQQQQQQQAMEETLGHQTQLSQIASEELSLERQRVKEMKKRESKLFQLLAQVEKVYQTEIHHLRQDLLQIRAAVETLGPYTELEIHKTMGNMATQLSSIFKHLNRKHEEDLLHARISLSNSHAIELNTLEQKFMKQIESHSEAHADEMDALHKQLVEKAENVLSLRDAQAAAAATAASDFDNHGDSNDSDMDSDVEEEGEEESSSAVHADKNAPKRSSSSSRSRSTGRKQGTGGRRAVRFSLDESSSSQSTTHVSNGGSDKRHHRGSAGQQRRHMHRSSSRGGGSSYNDSSSLVDSTPPPPAFESVVRGLMEALEAEEICDKHATQKVLSLANVHQEPSFAAQAAAKSIVSTKLEEFVNHMQEHIFSLTTRATTAGTTTTSASATGTIATGTTGTTASSSSAVAVATKPDDDYSLFFLSP